MNNQEQPISIADHAPKKVETLIEEIQRRLKQAESDLKRAKKDSSKARAKGRIQTYERLEKLYNACPLVRSMTLEFYHHIVKLLYSPASSHNFENTLPWLPEDAKIFDVWVYIKSVKKQDRIFVKVIRMGIANSVKEVNGLPIDQLYCLNESSTDSFSWSETGALNYYIGLHRWDVDQNGEPLWDSGGYSEGAIQTTESLASYVSDCSDPF